MCPTRGCGAAQRVCVRSRLRMTRQRWLWSAKPRSAARRARSCSPPASCSSALRARRRMRWREIVWPVAARKMRLRWWGETASSRARSGRERSGFAARISRAPSATARRARVAAGRPAATRRGSACSSAWAVSRIARSRISCWSLAAMSCAQQQPVLEVDLRRGWQRHRGQGLLRRPIATRRGRGRGRARCSRRRGRAGGRSAALRPGSCSRRASGRAASRLRRRCAGSTRGERTRPHDRRSARRRDRGRACAGRRHRRSRHRRDAGACVRSACTTESLRRARISKTSQTVAVKLAAMRIYWFCSPGNPTDRRDIDGFVSARRS